MPLLAREWTKSLKISSIRCRAAGAEEGRLTTDDGSWGLLWLGQRVALITVLLIETSVNLGELDADNTR